MTLILPVVHHLDRDTTIQQALLALRCGADGVFLISHRGEDEALLPLGSTLSQIWAASGTARGRRPFVGLNLLTLGPVAAFESALAAGVDGVWIDAPGITSAGVSPGAARLADLAAARPALTVFASVAFKYQPQDHDPAKAAATAKALGMVPVTSGPATGVAPSLEKILSMSGAADGLLGVASGMDVRNARSFAPHLSHILVATGVSVDEHHFDESLLRGFVRAVRDAGAGARVPPTLRATSAGEAAGAGSRPEERGAAHQMTELSAAGDEAS